MKNLARYTRLYLSFIRFSFIKSAIFRFDTSLRFFSDIFYYLAYVLFYKVLFLNYSQIGDWNESYGMIFVWSFLCVDALFMTFFASSTWQTVNQINSGYFDFQLVRPVSSVFMSFFKDIYFTSFFNFLLCLGMLITMFCQLEHPASFFSIAGYILMLLSGVVIYFCIRVLLVSLTFWVEQSERLLEGFFGLTTLMEVPHVVYRGMMKLLLLTILPFGLMVSFPVRYLSHGLTTNELILFYSVLISFIVLTKIVWQAGTRAYNSASS